MITSQYFAGEFGGKGFGLFQEQHGQDFGINFDGARGKLLIDDINKVQPRTIKEKDFSVWLLEYKQNLNSFV